MPGSVPQREDPIQQPIRLVCPVCDSTDFNTVEDLQALASTNGITLDSGGELDVDYAGQVEYIDECMSLVGVQCNACKDEFSLDEARKILQDAQGG